jgi:hypothetical protein
MNQVLLLLDNIRPNTILCAREAIATMGWKFHPHHPYSFYSARSDFHLFGALKDALRERRVAESDELKQRRFSKELQATCIQRLT